jgi:MFS family permease
VVIAMPVWNLVSMLLLGAFASGIYMLSMVMVGERFSGADLAAASALLGLMFGAGSVLGPAVGGLAREFFPPHGVPFSIGLMFVAFLPVIVVALLRKDR